MKGRGMPTTEAAFHARLMAALSPRVDAFDCAITAAILSVSFAEAHQGGIAFTEACGLNGAELADVFAHLFPSVAPPVSVCAPLLPLPEEEAALRALLTRGATAGSRFRRYLAAMIARRAQRHNHLWQDLGFENRAMLGRLMDRHFAALARANQADMKWKKFFSRQLCADADFALCVAPSCDRCKDYDDCFGAEEGESLSAALPSFATQGIG